MLVASATPCLVTTGTSVSMMWRMMRIVLLALWPYEPVRLAAGPHRKRPAAAGFHRRRPAGDGGAVRRPRCSAAHAHRHAVRPGRGPGLPGHHAADPGRGEP